jgi:hypothetical protein
MYINPVYMVQFLRKTKTPLERGIKKIVRYNRDYLLNK